MKSVLLGLVKINANYYSFLSGIFIAVSTNLYTGVFSGDVVPVRWTIILSASMCTFVSSLCWIFISWKLDPIQSLVMLQSPKEVQQQMAYTALLKGKELILALYFTIALISAVLGLGIMTVGY